MRDVGDTVLCDCICCLTANMHAQKRCPVSTWIMLLPTTVMLISTAAATTMPTATFQGLRASKLVTCDRKSVLSIGQVNALQDCQMVLVHLAHAFRCGCMS